MPFPEYIATRTISAGGAATVESNRQLKIRATLRSTKSLVWADSGFQFLQYQDVKVSELGTEVTFNPPRTDLAGWKDYDTKALIDVSAEGSFSHRYLLLIEYLDENDAPIGIPPQNLGPFALPDGVGTYDVDKSVVVGTVAGDQVSIPDLWSRLVADAEAAAAAAQAAIVDSAEFVGAQISTPGTPARVSLEGTIDAVVEAGLTAADIPGQVESAVAADPTVAAAAAAAVGDALGGIYGTARTNRATNPELASAATGWTQYFGSGGAGSGARIADPDDAARWVYRLTWSTGTSTPNGGSGFGRSNNTDIPVTGSVQGVYSIAVEPSVDQRLRIELKFYDDAGVQQGSTVFGTSSLIAAGVRTRISVATTAPAGATRAAGQAVATTGTSAVNWAIGNTLIVGYAMWEELTTVAGPYIVGTVTEYDLATGTDLTAESASRTTGDAERIKPTYATLPGTGTALSKNDLTYHLGHDLQVIATGYTTTSSPIADLKAGKLRRVGGRAFNAVAPTRPITAYGAAAWARVNPPIVAIPPTVEYLGTDITMNTALGGGYTEKVQSAISPIKLRGCYPTTATVDGITVMRNVFNGSTGPRQPFYADMVLDVTGWDEAFAIRYVGNSSSPAPSIQVLIDGRPADTRLYYDPSPSTTAERLVRVGGLKPGPQAVQVRLYNMDLYSFGFSDGITVREQPRDLPTMGMLWNSWGELATAWAWWQDGILPRLADMLGVEAYFGGQGGWGVSHPVASGGKTPIADAGRNRLLPVVAVAPDWLMLKVAQQDEGNTAGFQAALEDVLDYLNTSAPDTAVLVSNVEVQSGSNNGNKSTITAATIAACAVAPNVVGAAPYASPYGDHTSGEDRWVSGLYSSPGWGSADLEMYRGDTAHPSIFGTAMWAVREYESIVQHLRLANAFDGRGFTMDKTLLTL